MAEIKGTVKHTFQNPELGFRSFGTYFILFKPSFYSRSVNPKGKRKKG